MRQSLQWPHIQLSASISTLMFNHGTGLVGFQRIVAITHDHSGEPCPNGLEIKSGLQARSFLSFKAIQTELMDARTRSKSISGAYRKLSQNACSAYGGISLSRTERSISDSNCLRNQPDMSTEIRNWDLVAKAMEASGATSSQMYRRAKALAQGKLDPMPTSSPEAPYSISAVAG